MNISYTNESPLAGGQFVEQTKVSKASLINKLFNIS